MPTAVVLGALSLVVGAVLVLRGRFAATTPLPSAPVAVAQRGAEPADGSVSPSGEVERGIVTREADVAPRRGIHGILLDSAGEPLAGYGIVVRRIAEEADAQVEQVEPKRAEPADGVGTKYLVPPIDTARRALVHDGGVAMAWREGRSTELVRDEESVESWEVGAPGAARASCITDGDGRFASAQRDAGRYQVFVEGTPLVGAEVELQPRGLAQVELRLPPGMVAVELQFEWNGKLLKHTEARLLRGGRERRSLRPDEQGCMRCVLPWGPYAVRAYESRQAFGRSRLCVGEFPAFLPEHRARLQMPIALGGADLNLTFVDPAGEPANDLQVILTACMPLEPQPVKLVARTSGNELRLPRLPAAAWSVSVRGPRVQSGELEPVEFSAGDRDVDRTLVVQAACIVRLELRDRAGGEYRPREGPMPVLVAAEKKFECKGRRGGGSLRQFRLEYESVPAGSTLLLCRDEEVDESGVASPRYLPFDELPDQAFEIDWSEPQVLMLEILPRAFVEIRACERSGRERRSARVTVWDADVPIRPSSLVDNQPQRWRGYLPPGSYRVVVEHEDVRVEHRIVVARRNLQLRLRD